MLAARLAGSNAAASATAASATATVANVAGSVDGKEIRRRAQTTHFGRVAESGAGVDSG